jgi:hypothetical protein
MGRLNAPREVPYEFFVVEVDGMVWLYDNSERTHACDCVPKVWMEPLYAVLPEDEALCPRCKSGTIVHNRSAEGASCSDRSCEASWNLELPDSTGDYFNEDILVDRKCHPIQLPADETAPGTPNEVAWASAREEADANPRI